MKQFISKWVFRIRRRLYRRYDGLSYENIKRRLTISVIYVTPLIIGIFTSLSWIIKLFSESSLWIPVLSSLTSIFPLLCVTLCSLTFKFCWWHRMLMQLLVIYYILDCSLEVLAVIFPLMNVWVQFGVLVLLMMSIATVLYYHIYEKHRHL